MPFRENNKLMGESWANAIAIEKADSLSAPSGTNSALYLTVSLVGRLPIPGF
jgi:hypothetical protein